MVYFIQSVLEEPLVLASGSVLSGVLSTCDVGVFVVLGQVGVSTVSGLWLGNVSVSISNTVTGILG